VGILMTQMNYWSHSAFKKCFIRNRNTMGQCISYLQTARKPMIQLGGRFCIRFAMNRIEWNKIEYNGFEPLRT
jgi:hypothetical protein